MKRPLGNAELLALFENGIKDGTLSHAYMLCAPAGSGKKTVADFAAAIALCLDGQNTPCGKCRSCAMLNAGAHPDLVRIKPDGDKVKSVKIEAIRGITDVCYIKPAVGNRRVFIIERAETITVQAQNALLKILEEPPAGTVFLLLTDSADKLLPTVRSRCVILNLSPLSDGEVESLLPKNSLVGKGQAVSFAAGVAGDALYVSTAEGSRIYADAQGFLQALMSRNMFELLKYRDKIAKSREAAQKMIEFTLKLLRDVCAVKMDEQAQIYFCGSRELVLDATNKLTKKALINIISILQNLKSEAENNSLDLKLCTASALLLCWEEIH